MKRDAGAVLINALVLVLVISAIAAALLTRAEGARIRASETQVSAQLGLYLDGIEALTPTLLKDPTETGTAHKNQPWAQQVFSYEIDRGGVTARLTDLQAGLNVNWLLRADAYAQDTFTHLFAELGVPLSLVDAITEDLAANGPMAIMPQLRQIEGMTPAYFGTLAPHLSALPPDTKLNLNTASKPVLRAALAPFPPELVGEFLARDQDEPMDGLSEFRNRLIEILETEDIDGYPVDRLTTGSDWFGALLTATLDGHQRTRRVVLHREVVPKPEMLPVFRWTEFD